MPIRTFVTVIALFICSIATTAQMLSSTDPVNIPVKKAPHSYSQAVYIRIGAFSQAYDGIWCGTHLHVRRFFMVR